MKTFRITFNNQDRTINKRVELCAQSLNSAKEDAIEWYRRYSYEQGIGGLPYPPRLEITSIVYLYGD
jgi:hypothetical protein